MERGILLAMILSMLFVWPYGGIREDKKDSSLSEDYGYTEPLQVGEYASQYFIAETDFLKTLEIAVNYNEEEARNGLLGLEIWKEDQKIYEGVIPYDAMESATFFPAVIETWLKRGAVYEYRIVNQSISLCRTTGDAPEVDGNVCVSSEEPLYPGQFYDVLVDDSDLYDLYGTVAK